VVALITWSVKACFDAPVILIIMQQYLNWQVFIALGGILCLVIYLNAINIITSQEHPIEVTPIGRSIYREGIVDLPVSFNPLLDTNNPIDQDVVHFVFEGLLREDGFGNLEPVLAKDWHMSEDGTMYEFELHQNIHWSDGKPFTSDDVIFTLNLLKNPDFPSNPTFKQAWKNVGIKQIGHTIQFTLENHLPVFPYYTTFKILPKHILEDVPIEDFLTHDFNLSPIGTGPFKLVEATDKHILLNVNEYHLRTRPHMSEIEFNIYHDTNALIQAFVEEEIDAFGQYTPQVQHQVKSNSITQTSYLSHANLYNASLPRYSIIYFNLLSKDTLSFFQEADIRHALFMAIDRQAIIDELLTSQAYMANGPIPLWNWAYNHNQLYPTHDTEQAFKLLDQMGWVDTDGDSVRDKDGVPFTFTMLVVDDDEQIAIAKQISQYWHEIGIDSTVEPAYETLTSRLQNHDFEAALVEIKLLGDPNLYPFWHQSQIEEGQNFAGWDNSEASTILVEAQQAIEKSDRIMHYLEFQRIFATELPAIVLHYPVYNYLVHDKVKNVQLTPLNTPADRFRTFSEWYIKLEE